MVQSVAQAMQTFSVTPEILESHFAKHRDEVSRVFSNHKDEIEAQFSDHKADTNKRFDRVEEEIRELRKDMHALQRSMTRFIWTFSLLVFGTGLTALITLLVK